MSSCVIPQSVLLQNCHRAPRAKTANVQRQCDASVNKPDFPPIIKGSEPKIEGGTFSPALIPSPAMNHQPLSQPWPHRNQSLVSFVPKPGLSNLALFITPVIRPLLPHRTTCPVPSRFTPTLRCISVRLSSWPSRDQHISTSCPGNLSCPSPELATAAWREGY